MPFVTNTRRYRKPVKLNKTVMIFIKAQTRKHTKTQVKHKDTTKRTSQNTTKTRNHNLKSTRHIKRTIETLKTSEIKHEL